MADLGVKLTDEKMKALTRRLEKVYSEAYKKAVENNKDAIEKLASLTDDKLEGLTDKQKEKMRRELVREVERTESITKSIAQEVSSTGKIAAKIIQNEMTNIYGLNYDFGAFDIQRQTGLQLDFTVYDRNQIAVLIQEEQSPFTQIAYNNLGKDKIIVERLQNQLLQATILGESQAKIIQRIKAVTGQSTSQAKRVAQTERTRVQSQARNQSIIEANKIGVETDRQWISRMDAKVRDDHAEVTGEIVKDGQKFSNGLEYPGDPAGRADQIINCRCYEKPMVVSTSPALKKHREKFAKSIDFEGWRASR